MNVCQSCHTPIDPEHTLCPRCELRLSLLLLQLAGDITPLRDSLDATLHPGGHQPTRIQTATPPTPLRLDVLDLLDLIDMTAYAWLRRLDGTNPVDWTQDRRPEDLIGTLTTLAAHPGLATHPDAMVLLHETTRFADMADRILDPPEERQPIGHCLNPLCGVQLTAGSRDTWVTCPMCGTEQRVRTVRLKRLERLCFDQTRHGSAAEVARVFTGCGLTVRRNTITQWERRGRLHRHPDGYAYSDVYRLLLQHAA
ncbi:hypothetical protein EMO89_01585 [Bifidobacterium tissieri]|uniref:PhnA protein n=1 Tax=Bifidobacterium tissieri TaxID=1630162 RepID=A0A5M9ZVV4_9BIFI|nr:hypothetical protein EMO89_01585 [Bifidobacterium tissieri]